MFVHCKLFSSYEPCSVCATRQVLFLGEEAEDDTPLVGGELAIVDALARTDENVTVPTSGLVIEPVRGRLVLFTGGGENYHSPLAVVRGRRTTYHVWFKCSCDDYPGEDYTYGGEDHTDYFPSGTSSAIREDSQDGLQTMTV